MYVVNEYENFKIMPIIGYLGFAPVVFTRFFGTIPDYIG
ncbi:UNVERIFIED_ORG: hypothetical protein ABIC97_003292 [Peribacillus simplex]|jgi:hypothetical protein